MVRARLARHGLRYTPGRRLLAEALARAGQPLTLPDIAAAAPDLPVSSTYRHLEVLERAGVVHRIVSGGERAHFELAEPLLSHHHHLVCVNCGAVEDMHLPDELEDLVDQNLAEAARRSAFTPLRHLLDLHGHCSQCERSAPLTGAERMDNLRYPAPLYPVGVDQEQEHPMGHTHTDDCYDHPEHSHADHADHCGMAEHSHADHCDEDHDHADHCDTPEHSHADHADHCDVEEHTHTEECCKAA